MLDAVLSAATGLEGGDHLSESTLQGRRYLCQSAEDGNAHDTRNQRIFDGRRAAVIGQKGPQKSFMHIEIPLLPKTTPDIAAELPE